MVIPAFQYLILKLALKYVDISFPEFASRSEIEKLSKFSGQNNFGKLKATLACYLVSIGNGQKKQLIQFFQNNGDNFIPESFGIIHKTIDAYIFETQPQDILHFDFDKCYVNIDCLNGQSVLDFVSDGIDSFDFSTTLTNIDKSIEFIHKERQPKFAIMSYEKYSEYSRTEEIYIDYSNKYWECVKVEQDFAGQGISINLSLSVLKIFNRLLPNSSHQFSPLGT